MAEVKTPKEDLLLGCFVEQLGQGVAELFGYAQTEEEPVVLFELSPRCFSCPALRLPQMTEELTALVFAGRRRGRCSSEWQYRLG